MRVQEPGVACDTGPDAQGSHYGLPRVGLSVDDLGARIDDDTHEDGPGDSAGPPVAPGSQ